MGKGDLFEPVTLILFYPFKRNPKAKIFSKNRIAK